jgi:hypothetical protein
MSKVKQAGIRFFPLGEWIIRKGQEAPTPFSSWSWLHLCRAMTTKL